MKKHKVEIPEGYKPGPVEYDLYHDEDGNEHYLAARMILIKAEKQLPKTWEEYCQMTKHGKWMYNITKITDSYYHSQMESLYKLLRLRDHYNDGWKPDWTDEKNNKWCIRVVKNEIRLEYFNISQRVLSFKNETLITEFFSNFRELIEIAKPLL